MGKIKPLENKAAIEKIKEMVGGGQIVMFCCNLETIPFDVTPMSTQQVEEDGTIWFYSSKNSERNSLVKKDERVQLVYGNKNSTDYLSIFGTAEVLENKEKAKELWSNFAKIWFPKGPEDPNLSLIRFQPSEGHYWDTKNNKIVSLAKMVAAVVTGNSMDDGVSGSISV
jgi:general stress protein 26